MLVIINCILALIFFFVFFIMLHSEPSFIKLAIVINITTLHFLYILSYVKIGKFASFKDNKKEPFRAV